MALRNRPERTDVDRDEHDWPTRAKERAADAGPERPGDVLGLSDADPDVEIPQATTDRGGHPAGIEVRERATGIGDVPQSKGATGIDTGAGTDTGLTSRPERPKAAEDPEE